MSGFSSSSLTSCPRSLIFFGTASVFHYHFQHCVQIFLIFLCIVSKHRLSFSASRPAFIIFFGIVSRFSSSSSASCPSIASFLALRQPFSSSSLASCLSFAYLFGIASSFHYFFRHRVWIFLIFLGIMSEHRLPFSALCPDFSYLHWHSVRILIFPGIVLGFLLVLQSWRLSSISLWYWVRGQNCWSSGFFTRVHFTLSLLVLRTHD